MTVSLQVPLTVAPGGGLAVLAQGSWAEVAQSVRLLLGTRPGQRGDVPDYGSPERVPLPVDTAAAEAAVQQWEPRAEVLLSADPAGRVAVSLTVADSSDSAGPRGPALDTAGAP